MFQVSVFISHSWKYSEHYQKLSEWLFIEKWNVDGAPLVFNDTSVPKENPIHNAPNTQALRDAIYSRINNSNVVVIPTGLYANYSNWIQKEIDGARCYSRPILAVNPWAQKKASSVVSNAAAEQVGWTKQSVANGVWQLAKRSR
ncbi:TIR domain-containing protein [Litoreibacter janthinus]|uniref:MTH538 TIR-like domain n=1 Tax=Litoreibacter janthinus TaxID=670154 RepID=A0A1I6HG22_9RHOB|nr:TIR domain-containing protein [Litoreibacter janthinus]SFR53443.1 MTH538 TIR-like domain [Litoreibacter janthinus]